MLVVTPGYAMIVEMVKEGPGGNGFERGTVRIVELKALVVVAVKPAGQCIETVGEGRPRVRREPAVADQELAR